MKILRLVLIVLLLISLTSCFSSNVELSNRPLNFTEMQELIPEMIEIFELSRVYLDSLRDGNFANLGTTVAVNNQLIIGSDMGGHMMSGIPLSGFQMMKEKLYYFCLPVKS